MVVFEDLGPVDECLPIETAGPSGHADSAAPEFDGEHGLPELPVLEPGIAPDLLEEGCGGFLRIGAMFAQPAFDPFGDEGARAFLDPGMGGDGMEKVAPSLGVGRVVILHGSDHENINSDLLPGSS